MPKIVNFSVKAQKTRERVQKCRNLKRKREKYEKEVEKSFKIYSAQTLINNKNGPVCDKNEKQFDLRNELAIWGSKHRITKLALNDLLAILILAGFTFLPKDSRTLMKTPKTSDINLLSNGKMWYNGVDKCLQKVLSECNRNLNIKLDFNVDGLPLFNSSKLQFWPILMSIRG